MASDERINQTDRTRHLRASLNKPIRSFLKLVLETPCPACLSGVPANTPPAALKGRVKDLNECSGVNQVCWEQGKH